MKTSDSIADFPFMSPVSVAMLARIDVHTREQLRDLGSLKAYARLKRNGAAVSLPLLWAIEAAVTGRPMGDLSPGRQAELVAAHANLMEPTGPLDAPDCAAHGVAPHVRVTECERVARDRTWPSERPE